MFSLTIFVAGAHAHFNMVWPPTWFDPNGDLGMTPHMQCANAQCEWFSNFTFVNERVMAADSPMRTYQYSDPDYTIFGKHPWAAPGRAKVWSPCGVAGGNPHGCPYGVKPAEQGAAQMCEGDGFGWGPDARMEYNNANNEFGNSLVSKISSVVTTDVEMGAELEIHWSISANHGGGYAYRLCKTPEDGDMMKVTEECFQKGHLEFASDTSYFQFGSDSNYRFPFTAVTSNNGTYPEGSSWRANPVPACASLDGGKDTETSSDCFKAMRANRADGGQQYQFTPRVPGFGGYATHKGANVEDGHANWANEFAWNVVDVVKIPEDLEPGKYVLGFRWDCEQTYQIWSSCSDLNIKAKNLTWATVAKEWVQSSEQEASLLDRMAKLQKEKLKISKDEAAVTAMDAKEPQDWQDQVDEMGMAIKVATKEAQIWHDKADTRAQAAEVAEREATVSAAKAGTADENAQIAMEEFDLDPSNITAKANLDSWMARVAQENTKILNDLSTIGEEKALDAEKEAVSAKEMAKVIEDWASTVEA